MTSTRQLEQSTHSVLSLPGRSRRVSRPGASLAVLRRAVAGAEDADAKLTGMTRSLDRRLLALNLQPVESALMKVA